MNNQIEKPLFFLFTCVKDGRTYINKLFSSLLSQTRINFVHYIYEDGSVDPLDEIVDDYKTKVSKLPNPYKVIYEKNPINIGLNMSTKHCIEMCYLPYFIWIDCDNWINNIFFEEMERTVISNPDGIVFRANRVKIRGHISNKTLSFSHVKRAIKSNQTSPIFYAYFDYSAFAVNMQKYKSVNPSLYLMNKRDFFNDEQVIMACSCSKDKFVFCKKAILYYLYRTDSEFEAYKTGRHREDREKLINQLNCDKDYFLNIIFISSLFLQMQYFYEQLNHDECKKKMREIEYERGKIGFKRKMCYGKKGYLYWLIHTSRVLFKLRRIKKSFN